MPDIKHENILRVVVVVAAAAGRNFAALALLKTCLLFLLLLLGRDSSGGEGRGRIKKEEEGEIPGIDHYRRRGERMRRPSENGAPSIAISDMFTKKVPQCSVPVNHETLSIISTIVRRCSV